MTTLQNNRATFDEYVAIAEQAAVQQDFAAAATHLRVAATYAWENYTGVFLDRRIESLIDTLADHINEAHPLPDESFDSVGFLMTGMYEYGGHSKIAWRWMQLDESNRFALVLIQQGKSKLPEQLTELSASGRVSVSCISESEDCLTRARHARDALAGSACVVMSIHPDDIIGAIAAACLKKRSKLIFIDHAFFSISVGMTSAHAVCCTSPAAVRFAMEERLVSPEHLVVYRNSPEWLGDLAGDPKKVREELDLPDDAVLLLSSGSEYKFYPINGISLVGLVAPVLEANPNAYLVIVGVQERKNILPPGYMTLLAERIKFIAPVPEREFLDYVQACDIYLDSVPFHSGGAAQQAMLLSKPVLNFAEPDMYRSGLSPQFYSVDDFSWFHFSEDAYRADLLELCASAPLRLSRGQYLSRQVASQIDVARNLMSIEESYRRASRTPQVAVRLLSQESRVDHPLMHKMQLQLAANFSASRHGEKAAPRPVSVPVQAPPSRLSGAADILRLIAFHLPQFHAIPENDAWWGKGFTEWDNVKLGAPLFDGHYQPHVPSPELGYYNLLDVEALRRQAELARSHGVYGFCFYYYWFDRKRLLEKPVDLLLANPDIDLPFCLCWANENWTRRWDGGDKEILIAQSYSPELNEKFAEDLIPYFSDPRYIRVEGKPVLLVYRSDIIPDLKQTLESWRQTWRDAGIGEAYLIGVESFQFFSPDAAGFDANCEFLPHQVDFSILSPEEPLKHPKQHIQSIGDYEKLADFWSSRPRADYKRFRGLVPSWDNSARRRKGGATMLVNASPEAYKGWLGKTLRKTMEEFEGDERLVFINAWNEWGEGCHLEPDVKNGLAYLEATRDAVNEAVSVADEICVQPDPSFDSFVKDYGRWVASRTLSLGEANNLPARIESYSGTLQFTVVISDSEGSPELLNRSLQSIFDQYYPAASIVVFSAQKKPSELSDRILWLEHGDVWSEMNRVIPSVEGDWFYLLRAGDVLDPHALVLLSDRLDAEPSLASIYSDEDSMAGAQYRDPFFKPDFNLDFLRSYPYCGRTLAFEKDSFLAVGGFDPSFGELSPHDVMFKLVENRGLGSIGHIAEVLVHCDKHMGHWLAEEEVIANASRLTSNHLTRLGIAHSITSGALPMINRVAYHNASQPLVSIIIPTRDQLPVLRRCVETLIEKTRYANYELLIVDNASETPEAVAWLAGMEQLASDKVRILRYPQPFNYSAINNFAAGQARGEYLVLLNNDTAIIEPGWLDALLNHARRPEVGIVGAKLHFLDGTIQHGGVVLGLGGPADHPFIGEQAEAPGYMHRLQVDQNYSVVTAACLMIRASVYAEVGGLDEDDFKVSYNDVDLGLKVRYAGYLTVWTPYAVLLHEGSVSQRNLDSQYASSKKERFNSEQMAMYARWLPQIAEDPAYNKNLTLHGGGFSLAAENERFYWQPFAQKAVPSILCHAADSFGGGQYRVLQPFKSLAQAGLVQGGFSRYLLTPAQVERFKPDSVILQRQLLEPQINYVSRLKEFSTALKVYELDDYIIELPLGSQHRADFSREVVRSLRKVLSLCDRFVVSTEPLAAALADMHPDIRVVPNTLAPESWKGLQGQRRTSGKPRVGWAGGLGHGGDLRMIGDLVKALAGEVDWVFMGMCPDDWLPFIAEYHPGVPFDRYPKRLARLNLDLALAPLEQNRFNECKSNLRLLEYGACGFPVVCTDIEPYRCDLPVTLVKNRYKDWLNAIRAHLQDLDATAAMGDALQARVRSEWMLEGDNLLAWRNAWLPD